MLFIPLFSVSALCVASPAFSKNSDLQTEIKTFQKALKEKQSEQKKAAQASDRIQVLAAKRTELNEQIDNATKKIGAPGKEGRNAPKILKKSKEQLAKLMNEACRLAEDEVCNFTSEDFKVKNSTNGPFLKYYQVVRAKPEEISEEIKSTQERIDGLQEKQTANDARNSTSLLGKISNLFRKNRNPVEVCRIQNPVSSPVGQLASEVQLVNSNLQEQVLSPADYLAQELGELLNSKDQYKHLKINDKADFNKSITDLLQHIDENQKKWVAGLKKNRQGYEIDNYELRIGDHPLKVSFWVSADKKIIINFKDLIIGFGKDKIVSFGADYTNLKTGKTPAILALASVHENKLKDIGYEEEEDKGKVLKAFLNEVNLTHELSHKIPGLVKQGKMYKNGPNYVIPFQYFDGGNLGDQIIQRQVNIENADQGKTTSNTLIDSHSAIIQAAHQTLGQVGNLHRLGYVHKDLKPENIVINQNQASIMDFGEVIRIKNELEEKGVDNLGGSIPYQGPELEVLQNEQIESNFITDRIATEVRKNTTTQDSLEKFLTHKGVKNSKELAKQLMGFNGKDQRTVMDEVRRIVPEATQKKVITANGELLKRGDDWAMGMILYRMSHPENKNLGNCGKREFINSQRAAAVASITNYDQLCAQCQIFCSDTTHKKSSRPPRGSYDEIVYELLNPNYKERLSSEEAAIKMGWLKDSQQGSSSNSSHYHAAPID